MKRGESGLSLVVGVDKPSGMTSHDVVNRCRRIFGEKRVGHTGTLDPLASGVLPICIGPATRLGAYLTGHDKAYRATIAFGVGTDTDDCEGMVTRTGEALGEAGDRSFAEQAVEQMLGPQKQMPPAYSAIKVNGKKSYEAAREGPYHRAFPRDIEVYSAKLIAVHPGVGEQLPEWDVEFRVSKGTYIRALARDLGHKIGCPAHLAALRRLEVGDLTLDGACRSRREELRLRAALDPVRLLGVRFAYVEGAAARPWATAMRSVRPIASCSSAGAPRPRPRCALAPLWRAQRAKPLGGEVIAVISQNKGCGLVSVRQQACIVQGMLRVPNGGASWRRSLRPTKRSIAGVSRRLVRVRRVRWRAWGP